VKSREEVPAGFLVPDRFANEIADDAKGPAFDWLERNEKAQLWIGPVTMTEVLEGASDTKTVKSYLARYSWQGIHRMHAEKVALRQRRSSRRMGENDAWQCALAEQMDAVIVGHDPGAFHRLGTRYEHHRRPRKPS
jgi:predicted nucleic acid-binding protein